MNPFKNYYIKYRLRLGFAIVTIVFSGFFFVAGFSSLEISKIFKEGYELQEKIVEVNDVTFGDNPKEFWLERIEIEKVDYEPLEINTVIHFHALITTKIIPQELIIHIFHEDMNDFFLGNEDSDYQPLTSELNRILTLRYGDMFNIKFNLTENSEERVPASYSYNGNEIISFKKSGTYFVLVSIKTQDGEILHYKGKTSVMKIRDSS